MENGGDMFELSSLNLEKEFMFFDKNPEFVGIG